MRNKNLLILIILLVLIVLVAVGAMVFKSQPDAASVTEAITGSASTDAAGQTEVLTGAGYVYITASGEGRWFELPEAESRINITRPEEDGTETFNVINLSPEGVFVESASCDNQDCVEQGVVTLENKSTRVLQNLIVCLPNEVSVELYSAEEVMAMLEASAQAEQE